MNIIPNFNAHIEEIALLQNKFWVDENQSQINCVTMTQLSDIIYPLLYLQKYINIDCINDSSDILNTISNGIHNL